ncbi:MAG TPA: hypothetical protein VHZ54_04180 [Solirubrobacterales bacterium]|jgi:hypothetical protein|nr:hypothetical protein [Solirubrobacterales bacterium]
MTDSERVIAVHEALAAAAIPHAIGGARALSFYAAARETEDIDVNVFVPSERRAEVEEALAPLGAGDPVHLFFSEDALHEAMPAAVRVVPFGDTTIPIVSPEHLVIRKAMLDRPKDWRDVEAILIATDPLDVEEIEAWLQRLAGEDDPRLTRFRQLAGR